MVLRPILPILVLGTALVCGSCNDNEFAGSGSGASKEADGGTGDACSGDPEADAAAGLTCGGTDDTPSQCVDGDKVNIQWTGPVGDCIGQGKTYNFEQESCTEMPQAKFECTWESVKAELEKRKILTEVLRSDSENGAKLVSCGQSEDGNRIVVQWIKAENAQDIDCTDGASSHHTTTGCYTLYKAGETKPPKPANEEEHRAQVYACMNQL